MLDVRRIVTGPLAENCYVVWCAERDAVVVDPGGEAASILECIDRHGLRLRAVLGTHAHYDHIGAVATIAERHGVVFHLHSADRQLLRRANFYGRFFSGQEAIRIPTVGVELAGGDELRLGALTVVVVHTPGHSPGSVCFEIGDELFTGDTLLDGRLGRTDLPGGDRDALDASVAMLAARYGPRTILRPGHGEAAPFGEVAGRLATLSELRG